jgi:phage gp36-like protein
MTTLTAYATADDFVAAFDEQTLKDLASDSGIPAASLSTDEKVIAALNTGAGRIEAACLIGKIYTTDDLAGLSGNSKALLVRLNCELGLLYLLARRPEKYGSDYFKALNGYLEDYLTALQQGKRLFATENAKDAGLPNVDGPNHLEFQDLNLITARTRNFYPNYGSRLPIGR